MKPGALGLAAILAITSCGAPARRSAELPVIPPGRVTDFPLLYAQNCAGCHGQHGQGGLAVGLGDAVYLAIADDTTIRRVTAEGVPGTAMPAFAQRSGGMLTDEQINAIVTGIRRWDKPHLLELAPPSYAALAPGDPKRGVEVYGTYCSSCHGSGGLGGTRAGSIVDGSYLTLVSDQYLRTNVIAGRPEVGMPDWRGYVIGKPMSQQDVSDVVAWLAAQRPKSAKQLYSTSQSAGGEIQ